MVVYNNRKRKYRKSVKRVARKSYARKTRSPVSIKKMIRKEIARNVENKTFQYLGTSYDIIYSILTGIVAKAIADPSA